MTLSISSPDELVAVIPHLLGFKPDESIVFLPMHSDLPVDGARRSSPVMLIESPHLGRGSL